MGNDEMPSLHLSIQHGLERVIAILDRGADVNEQHPGPGLKGQTPLMVASVLRRADVVRLLLERGAQVNAVDENLYTPLHWAASTSPAFPVVQALLESGAQVNAIDEDGTTPLMLAAIKGDTEVVRALLAHGADVDRQDFGGNTALISSAACGRTDCVQVLLDHGADVEAIAVGRGGWTALHFAACNGRLGCVELLLRQGANIIALNSRGQTPVELARNRGENTIVEMLSRTVRA